jgi:hypothetical protein
MTLQEKFYEAFGKRLISDYDQGLDNLDYFFCKATGSLTDNKYSKFIKASCTDLEREAFIDNFMLEVTTTEAYAAANFFLKSKKQMTELLKGENNEDRD